MRKKAWFVASVVLVGVAVVGIATAQAPLPHGVVRVAPPPTKPAVAKVASILGTPPTAAANAPPARRAMMRMLSPAKQPAVGPSPMELQVAATRAQKYQATERAAPPAIQNKVALVRAAVINQHLKFQVGVTAVSHKDLAAITGGIEPTPNAAALSAAKARRAHAADKGNLVRAQMIARAVPPPAVLAQHQARRNAGDVTAAAGPTSQNTNQQGQGKQPFPSSQNPSVTAPAFSWRDRMTPVKNQGECGSCWAFATTAVMETNEILYNGGAQSLDLAEQQLVNCTPNRFPSTGGDNCNGNTAEAVWKFLAASPHALETGSPYQGTMGSCDRSVGTAPYTVKDWGYVGQEDVKHPTVDEIKAAIVAHGPVAAGVNATPAFQNYTGGVFDEQDSGHVNHEITLTGWDDSKGAWYLRNSWSADWGEDGYMWIQYGSNSVGGSATWSQPASPGAPPTPTFADRYFSVANDTGEPINVFVEARVSSGGAWQWVPADPAPNAQAFQYSVAVGQTLDVKRTDTGEFLTAKAVRVWAASLDGARTWNANQNTDFTLAQSPYQAAQRDRSTLHLQPKGTATPTAAQMYSQANKAREANQLAEADAAYTQFVDHFPHHARIHEARFWLGWTQYMEKKFPAATLTLSNMIQAAPTGQTYIPFAFYFLGVAEAAEGYCGYAKRNLEVVSYGEVDAPPDWVQSAKTEIKVLNDDDGTICSNWN